LVISRSTICSVANLSRRLAIVTVEFAIGQPE